MLQNGLRWIKILAVCGLVFLVPMAVRSQEPVVYGVFFYSPTCPHCHDVMTNHWPGIQEEFGGQLQVLFINVKMVEGSQLMSTAVHAMNIPSNGVPMLIIGDRVLVGSADIPQRAPDIIRAGLKAGGIGYPPIPGIDAVFESVISEQVSASAAVERPALLDDPANVAALIVLGGLVAAIGVMLNAGWKLVTQRNRQLIQRMNGRLGLRMAVGGGLVGVVLAGSLVAGSFNEPVVLILSILVLAAFVILVVHVVRSSSVDKLSSGLTPLLLVVGLLVAGYLAYIETTLAEATCGVMGNCNAVQQSAYARIMGVPVGIIGIVAYITILVLWLVNCYRQRQWIEAVLFASAFMGVVFSIYLTVLEPFVIGASCVWCLTSAVVMGILLWTMAPSGWAALEAVFLPVKHLRKAA